MPKSRFQVVLISDLHVGSRIGLMPPQVELDDGDVVHANKLQLAAWRFWDNEFWPEVWDRQKKLKVKTIVIANGDLIDGNHHNTNQIWTNSAVEQILCASEILAPVAQKAAAMYVTRGTAAHVLASAMADEQIAREIGATTANGDRKARSAYHLKLNVGGVDFDIAHHGPNPGTRVWTYGDALRKFAKTIVFDTMMRGEKPPDIIVRGHVHKRTHETIRDYGRKTEVVITPSWQWHTEFVHSVASHEDISDIGGVIIDIRDGEIVDIQFKLLTLSQSSRVSIA